MDQSSFRIVSDIDECRELWLEVMPRDLITDLWEVRMCFHAHFQNTPHFIVSSGSSSDGINALLPLCRISDHEYYGYFPGETWHGKTWLEQNRIFCRNNMLPSLLEQVPVPHHIRYMLPIQGPEILDETGYLFEPPRYDYSMDNYLQEFSSKSRKRLKKDLSTLELQGVTYRYNNVEDFEYMADLNVQRFGQDSYFHDPRFRDGFRSLMNYLSENSMMRITTILVNGTIAAVDLGSIYKGTYTLLAGGTNADFHGIAKLINTHHMQYACEQKFSSVDFLCGDFLWKPLFHLTPRPLYMISDMEHLLSHNNGETNPCPTN